MWIIKLMFVYATIFVTTYVHFKRLLKKSKTYYDLEGSITILNCYVSNKSICKWIVESNNYALIKSLVYSFSYKFPSMHSLLTDKIFKTDDVALFKHVFVFKYNFQHMMLKCIQHDSVNIFHYIYGKKRVGVLYDKDANELNIKTYKIPKYLIEHDVFDAQSLVNIVKYHENDNIKELAWNTLKRDYFNPQVTIPDFYQTMMKQRYIPNYIKIWKLDLSDEIKCQILDYI